MYSSYTFYGYLIYKVYKYSKYFTVIEYALSLYRGAQYIYVWIKPIKHSQIEDDKRNKNS